MTTERKFIFNFELVPRESKEQAFYFKYQLKVFGKILKLALLMMVVVGGLHRNVSFS
jgi:hypothetical protein